jgi:hypothetical protein
MARSMRADAKHVFRAVVVGTTADGTTSTTVLGPYARRGDASRRVTEELGSYRWRKPGASAAGWVESAELEWKP